MFCGDHGFWPFNVLAVDFNVLAVVTSLSVNAESECRAAAVGSAWRLWGSI